MKTIEHRKFRWRLRWSTLLKEGEFQGGEVSLPYSKQDVFNKHELVLINLVHGEPKSVGFIMTKFDAIFPSAGILLWH